MQPYSDDLRQRIVQACDQGLAHRAVAKRFLVSLSFVEKLLHRRRATGAIAAQPHTGGRPSPLWAMEGAIRQWVAAQPDLTLAELRERLAPSLTPSVAALSRFLRRLGLVRKRRRSTPPSATGRRSRPSGRRGAPRSRGARRAR